MNGRLLPLSLTPAQAPQFHQQCRDLDQKAHQDLDPRPDFVEWSDQGQKVEVALEKHGFLARQSDAQGVTVVQCTLPKWYSLGGTVHLDVVTRSAQGVYSGVLAGIPIEAGDTQQDRARQSFFALQRPLKKPGNDG